MAGSRPLVSAAVDAEVKERLKVIAEAKKWTISHTVGIFLDMFLEDFEREMGVTAVSKDTTSKRKTKPSKTKPDIK